MRRVVRHHEAVLAGARLMGMPDVDDVEIAGAVKAILHDYGSVIGEKQARNIAYVALVGARGAKFEAKRKAARG
jgi:hypothetical protein